MPLTDHCELSVVIASYNRRDLLLRCLDSLGRQTQDPTSFEVIVADDGSTDGSAEMVESLQLPCRVRVLRLENRGQSHAQKVAVDAAAGRICLLLDDDVIASPELVAAHIAGHREHPQCLCIGALTQKPPAARDWYAHAFARAWNHHYGELTRREARWNDCYGGNLSFPRIMAAKIGGIPIDLPRAFDFDLALRLCKAGCVPKFLADAHGVHDDQKRRPRLIRDARELGVAYVELARLFPEVELDLLRWSAVISPRELGLRRILLALRLPSESLGRLGRILPGEGRKAIWLRIVGRVTLWRGVRESLTPSEWQRIVHDPPALAQGRVEGQ
ncbi:MAG: glycosyl transferase, group 2 family protein [Solirubrobacterales bacterium]|nr:glycosyl transferase, group 2 family protein [Solirubrobacterales bacterium]